MNPFSIIHVTHIFLHKKMFGKFEEEEEERAGRGGLQKWMWGRDEEPEQALGGGPPSSGQTLALNWMENGSLL